MPARTADPDFDEDGRPSKTQRKRESHELQSLGEAVAALPAARLARLALSDTLRGAIDEYRRTRSHEGRRRQMQFIGKLMRTVDADPIREAVAEYRLGGARQTLALHEAERWRSALIADDAALTRWVSQHAQTDVAQLRSLIRQARETPPTQATTGEAARQSRAFRALFQFIQKHLSLTP